MATLLAQYRDVTWSDDELIDADELNQMTSNERYLLDSITSGFYTNYRKRTGIKIACGVVPVPPQDSAYAEGFVPFGSYFSPTCLPVVVISHAGESTFELVGGPSHGNPTPDSRGFRFGLHRYSAVPSTNNFPGINYLHWIAIGF